MLRTKYTVTFGEERPLDFPTEGKAFEYLGTVVTERQKQVEEAAAEKPPRILTDTVVIRHVSKGSEPTKDINKVLLDTTFLAFIASAAPEA